MKKGSTVEKISLAVAVIIGMNAMVGGGIVTLPALLSSKAGPAGILSCVIAVITVLFVGLALGRVASLYPGKGWTYVYPAKWGGHLLGIISASAYLLGVFGGVGFIVQQAGFWAHRIFPFLDPIILSIIILAIIAILVMAGTEASSIAQYVIAACVVIPLVSTSIVCLFKLKPSFLTDINLFMPEGLGSIFAAAPAIIFCLLGFESIMSLYGVVRDPKKNVPRACVLSIICVGLLYVLFSSGILLSIPREHFSGGVQHTLSYVLLQEFPNLKFLSTFILIGAMFGIIGTLHSMVWSVSALFTDVLKKAKSKVVINMLEKKIWTNKVSVVVTSFSLLTMALFLHGETLVYLTVLFMIIPNILSIMLLLFRKEDWKSGKNIKTVLALAGCLIVVYFSAEHIIGSIMKFFS